MNRPFVSLCIPTNGVIEWVFPVLESIEEQQVPEELFETIIVDNGDNQNFKSKMKEYIEKHKNVLYFENKSKPFINEIETYKKANGILLKFVNHRTKLKKGVLQKLIEYARNNNYSKPITYFTNGVLLDVADYTEYNSFDAFVKKLSYWSSWSTGMSIWKEDLDKMNIDVERCNELFPHTNILFAERNKAKYIINNEVIFDQISQGNIPKGRYDLYYAFGIEYPSILNSLLKDGSISRNTYNSVLNDNLEFIVTLYLSYNIMRRYCSYDISHYGEMFGKYYSKKQFYRKLIDIIFMKIKNKIFGR